MLLDRPLAVSKLSCWALALSSLSWLSMPSTAHAAEPEASGDASAKVSTKKKGKAKADADASAPETSAAAVGMKKRIGFGAIRTLSGVNGLFLNGYLGNRVSLGMAFGVATYTFRDTDDNGEFTEMRTVGRLGIGPEIFFYPVMGERDQQIHADFGFGGRFMSFIGFLDRTEDEQGNTLDTPLEFDIELPARINLWIGRRVAISPEFGVVFRIVPGSREADMNGESDTNPGQGIAGRLGAADGPGFGFEFGDHAGFFMGIGLGYYFGKL